MIPVITAHSRLNSTLSLCVLWKSKTSFQITVKEQPYIHPCAFTLPLITHHSWIASCFEKGFLCLIRLKSFLNHTENRLCSQNMIVLSPSLFSEDPKKHHFKSKRCSTDTDEKYTWYRFSMCVFTCCYPLLLDTPYSGNVTFSILVFYSLNIYAWLLSLQCTFLLFHYLWNLLKVLKGENMIISVKWYYGFQVVPPRAQLNSDQHFLPSLD